MIRFKYGANRTVDTDQSISQTSKESSLKVNDAEKTELSTSLEFFETPTRYRRRPLSQEEIHLIEVGLRSITFSSSRSL